MKKFFIFLGIFFGLFLLALGGGFYWAKKQLVFLPQHLQAALKKERIDLEYEFAKPGKGLSLSFRSMKISGPGTPYLLSAYKASAEIAAQFAFPPIAFNLNLDDITLEENPTFIAAPKSDEKISIPASIRVFLTGLNLLSARAELNKIQSNSFGVEKSFVSFLLNRLSLDPQGNPILSAQIVAEIGKTQAAPWMPPVTINSNLALAEKQLELSPLNLQTAGLSVSGKAQVNLLDLKWGANLDLPKTDLAKLFHQIKEAALGQVSQVSGNAAIKVQAQGMGANPDSIQADGDIDFENVSATFKSPMAQGQALANSKIHFQKQGILTATGTAKVDLTQTEITSEATFKKPMGVPLVVEAKVDGDEDSLIIQQFSFALHNLKAKGSGKVLLAKPFSGEARFEIPKTSLEGWEKFFPKYQTMRAEGSIAANGVYRGVFSDWKNAEAEVQLQATKVRIPVIPELLSNKDLKVDGIVELDSQSEFSSKNGNLRRLTSKTELSLSHATVTAGTFQKAAGTPLTASLQVKTTGNHADIQKGAFRLGDIRASVSGAVDNFSDPVAKIAIALPATNVSELLSLASNLTKRRFAGSKGAVKLNAKVQGRLFETPFSPKVAGQLGILGVSFQYVPEKGHAVDVKKLLGEVDFTEKGLKAQVKQISFQKTQGKGSVVVSNFSPVVVSSAFDFSHFNLADFMDSQTTPTPAAPVVTSESDFRNNPVLKTLKARLTVNVREAAFENSVVQNIQATVDLDKLLLRVSPFKMNAFGGTIASDTVWNGRLLEPETNQKLSIENVDAKQFIQSYSPKYSSYLSGRLGMNGDIRFTGLTQKEIEKTISGTGTFHVKSPKLNSINLTKGPMESLKKLPVIGKNISRTDWEENLNDFSGGFRLENGQLLFSNLVLNGPYFKATGTELAVDSNFNLRGALLWSPTTALISGPAAEMLADESGKTSLPLTLGGTLQSPSVGIDSSVIASRTKLYFSRTAEKEKERALAQVKKKAQSELENQVKGGLKKFLGGGG